MKEARALRLLNREALDEVKNFRWDDDVNVDHFDNWYSSFPRAINLNINKIASPIDFSRLVHIQKLDLPTFLEDVDLNSLVHLRELDMRNTFISSKSICKLHKLEKLLAAFCKNIGDDVFEHMSKLQVVDIAHSSTITDGAFNFFSNVIDLDVSWSPKITNVAFDKLKNVQVLKIWQNRRLTSRALLNLPANMRRLDVSYTGVTDENMSKFKNLTFLDISGCDISYDCVRRIINNKMRLRANDCPKPLRLLQMILR
jgi:hypothetical protein